MDVSQACTWPVHTSCLLSFGQFWAHRTIAVDAVSEGVSLLLVLVEYGKAFLVDVTWLMLERAGISPLGCLPTCVNPTQVKARRPCLQVPRPLASVWRASGPSQALQRVDGRQLVEASGHARRALHWLRGKEVSVLHS